MKRSRQDQPPETEGRRRRVLDALKAHGPATAGELANMLGGGPVAMRAHLRSLTAAGLVAHSDDHRPVGRPVRRFRLTPAADSLFPKRYDLFAVKLVEAIVSELGEEALTKILGRWQADLERHLGDGLPPDPRARWQALAAHQSKFGFMASIRRRPHGLAVVEQNCPIARVAARFPQICEHEAALFSGVLGVDVAVTSCQARGDAVCVFERRPR
ncbi:MAG TPA: helix-turn-helix domain-containing protein [Haliangiales bacterium]|nr:helix-turn-helix domain-containing protein [Haliangiales bacterium]